MQWGVGRGAVWCPMVYKTHLGRGQGGAGTDMELVALG